MSTTTVVGLGIVAAILIIILLTGRKVVIEYRGIKATLNTDIPNQISDMADNVESVSKAVNHQDGDPIVEMVKQIVERERILFVKIDALQATSTENGNAMERTRRAMDQMKSEFIETKGELADLRESMKFHLINHRKMSNPD